MKPGKPLQRRTPLQARTALQARTQLQPGKPLARSGPVKPKRDTPRRRDRDDTSPEHGTQRWADVRVVIWMRALGRCEVCGDQVVLEAMQGHHRLTRRLGPDCPCNALALCAGCHHGPEVHAGPDAALEAGRILSRHGDSRPADAPVLLGDGRWVLLTCGGTYLPAT